jgi:hypothetical protein
MNKHLLPTIFLAVICSVQNIHAQAIGDYKSVASGTWNSLTTWQMYDGATWVAAVLPPTSLSGKITINDSVTVNDNDSADELIVTSSGVLNILAGHSLKLLNGPGTDLQCDGRFIVGVGGQLSGNDTSVSSMNYTSDKELDIDGGINPWVTFNGTSLQTIHGTSGSGYFGRQITLDNLGNLNVTGVVGFAGVNFSNGKIFVPGYFIIGQYSGSNFTGQGAGKFIDGNIDCILYDQTPGTFNLPTGIGNNYLPVTFNVTLAENKESGLTVSIVNEPATGLHTLPVGIDKVSAVRYYSITNPNNVGIANASLQLAYDSTDGVTDPTNLRIVKSDTSVTNDWVNIGGTGTAVTKGTITSTINFTRMGIFALANATGGTNTLPLRITSFTAIQLKQSALLQWNTTNEINTGYFIVERKDAINNWQQIATIAAKQTAASYSYTDNNLLNNNTYFYRLKEVDKDGSTYFSKTLQIRMGAISKMNITLMYPNPAKDFLHYSITAGNNDEVSVAIFNNNGKTINAFKAMPNQSLQLLVKNLPAGVYYFSVLNNTTGEHAMKKFIKQ